MPTPTHHEMIQLQAQQHELIRAKSFKSPHEYVLYVIHAFAYFQAAKTVKGKKILDFGCNTGFGTNILSETARETVGVDVSESALSTAREKYNRPRIRFELIDGVKLPFPDEYFDVTVSFHVIEHIVDIELYVNEIKRVLKPEGLVMFTTPNASLRLDPEMSPWNKFHVQEFTHDQFYSTLQRLFSNVVIQGSFANEPLYSIEYNRLTDIRKHVRNKNRNLELKRKRQGSFFYKAKMLLPANFKRNIKTLWKTVLTPYRKTTYSPRSDEAKMDNKSLPNLEDLVGNYGVEEMFYMRRNLENALDLMAFCGDCGKSFEKYKRYFKLKNPDNR